MKVKVVECVPNFSEGQSKEIIQEIAESICNTDGVDLLDTDCSLSTNRTVFTFVGSPDDVIEGALNAARTAYKHIDMIKHKGEHPRLGALDVCPFIPVQGVEMEECIYCARKFGEKLAAELNVPVFLYGFAAQYEHRKTVSQIRVGEYEGLKEKITKPEWKPDYGPAEFISRWGATICGARKFLIVYNINVLGTKEQAHRIALNIREQGRGADQPGCLRNCHGIGWWLDEASLAQVSLNLTDHDITPIHTVYEEAVNRLGLNSLGHFNPKEKIIEYRLPDQRVGPLAKKTVQDFIRAVTARTPAPGGGSVAAAVAAMGSALGAMVGQMTYGKRQWEIYDGHMRKLIPVLHNTMKELITLIDADTTAFNDYMAAMKLPTNTPEEIAIRETAMEAGLKKAIEVPMSLARHVNKVWEAAKELASLSNIGTKSDLQVGVKCLETGLLGACWNVTINMEGVKDEIYKQKILEEVEHHRRVAETGCQEVLSILHDRQ
ncbi:formimidoyltransferase-cyclodeaminase-like isoform X2 [Tachypleus tridentatus]|uniref:formimidoyltransferase-cyclodeaminase-like isoform X2 n=1 Tax=Tachypleus tridentatus TaxID=6853 RepID=UPI003FD6A3FC